MVWPNAGNWLQLGKLWVFLAVNKYYALIDRLILFEKIKYVEPRKYAFHLKKYSLNFPPVFQAKQRQAVRSNDSPDTSTNNRRNSWRYRRQHSR